MSIPPRPMPGEQPPMPVPPVPIPEPRPVREPEPDRLPDEGPIPNPDEHDAPPQHAEPMRRATMNEPLQKTKARQGRAGWPVLLVLVAALVLLGLVWLVVGFYGQAIEPENPVGPGYVNGEGPAGTGEPAPAE